MFCTRCGKELEEGVKFCTACGTPVEEAAGGAAPGEKKTSFAARAGETLSDAAHRAQDAGKQLWDKVSDGVEDVLDGDAAEKGKSLAKKLGWKLPVIAVAAVVVVALLIMLFSGAFLGPKGKLAAALKSSLDEYSQACEDAGLPDPELVCSNAAKESIFVELEEVEGSSAMEGLGIRLDAAYNLNKRAFSTQITPFAGAVDLVTVQLAVEDNRICVASPQLLEGQFYGLDTETLGADVIALGTDLGLADMENISFNLFDMAEYAMKATQPGKAYEEKLNEAVKEFVKAIEVERDGKKLITVNDADVKCTLYRVTLPAAAVVALAEDLENLPADIDYESILVTLLSMTGLSEDTVAMVMDSLEDDLFSTEQPRFAESVKIMMNALGDVELNTYVKGGKLMAAVYENEVNGDDVKAGVYLGGGSNYVDNLSVVLNVNRKGSGFVLRSYGNHTGRGGTFTDETVVEQFYNGQSTVVLESALKYSPKETEDNFTWVLDADGITVDAEGTLTVKGKTFSLLLDELEVREDRVNVIALSAGFSVEEYSPVVNVKKPVMLSRMTEEDVMELADQVMADAMSLLGTLAAEAPVLGGLLFGF